MGDHTIEGQLLDHREPCWQCCEDAWWTCDICDRPVCVDHAAVKGGVASTCRGEDDCRAR